MLFPKILEISKLRNPRSAKKCNRWVNFSTDHVPLISKIYFPNLSRSFHNSYISDVFIIISKVIDRRTPCIFKFLETDVPRGEKQNSKKAIESVFSVQVALLVKQRLMIAGAISTFFFGKAFFKRPLHTSTTTIISIIFEWKIVCYYSYYLNVFQ